MPADVWLRHAAARTSVVERFQELPHVLRQEVAWEQNRRLLARLPLFRHAIRRPDWETKSAAGCLLASLSCLQATYAIAYAACSSAALIALCRCMQGA